MPVTNVASGLYSGINVEDLVNRSLDMLRIDRDKASKFDRYKYQVILDALNDGQSMWVAKTKCLKSFAVIEMKDGYSQYKPPSEYIAPERAYFYQSASSYWKLNLVTRDWLDGYKPGWKVTEGDPMYFWPGDSYGNLRKLGFYPKPDTDGTAYTTSPDTGVVASSTGVTTTGNITGQNTTAHATICTDSAARTLSDEGVTVGLMAVNVTDGSSGQISAVSGSTFTVTLTGGTANTWAVGDSFNVLAGEYGVVTSWDNDEKYLFSSDIGAMADVSTIVGNVYLEFVKRPLLLQFSHQYPEIPPEGHQYLPEYVVWRLKRFRPKRSEDYADAIAAKQAFDQGISEYAPHEQGMSVGVTACYI